MKGHHLADRTIRLETANRKTNLRPAYVVVLVLAILTAIRFALPTPPDRIRDTAVSDADLIAFVKNAQSPVPPAAPDAAAEFGSVVFNDNDFLPYQPGRQGRNESCSGCHQHESTGSSFLTSDRVAPDLRRSKYYTTFGIDGRSDTLPDFIADHIEFRTELASNRMRVVRLVLEKYRTSYQKAFGAPQITDMAVLTANGLPSMDRREFPVLVSSFILETLTDRTQIKSILDQAQQEHLAPAVIVSRAMLSPFLPDNTETENFQRLPVQQQEQINTIFANTVLALSAYIRALPDNQSAFDRFADRIAAGSALEESLVPEFNGEELTGLRLFHGAAQCSQCHNGPGFTDSKYYNLGLPDSAFPDAGRAIGLTLRNKKDICQPPSTEAIAVVCNPNGPTAEMIKETVGAFRTPALRGFFTEGKLTHNGQIEGVEDMLDFYSQLNGHTAIGVRDTALTALSLTKEEFAALASFLRTLGTAVPRGQFLIGKK